MRGPAHGPESEGTGSGSGVASGTTPVVMVVFDELPLLSLLDANRQIDPVLYPNFAALANEGVWFRNATTVSDFTRWAVPSIVSGAYPRRLALPNAVDHPDTVFTLLGRTHRLEVMEAVTRLCSETLCGDAEAAPLGTRLAAIARDVHVAFLLSVLTDDLTSGLPDVTATWAGFDDPLDESVPDEDAGNAVRDATSTASGLDVDGDDRAGVRAEVRRRWSEGKAAPPLEPVLRFIDGIGADDPQPTFYFLHTLVSHHPYYMLPNGKRNGTWVGIPGKTPGEAGEYWHWSADQPWAVQLQYQRHLLQMGFVDTLVGQLVRRLKDSKLYDRSLIVLASDHGTSYRPGATQRDFTGQNAAEIMRVPLIFKFPDGAGPGGTVSDANVETIDIVPTIADALGLEMTWQADGVSLLDASRPDRRTKVMFRSATGSKEVVRSDEPDMSGSLARKLALFGHGAENVHRAPRLAPFDHLIGQPLTALRIADGGGAAEILHAWEYEDVDPAAPEVPFDIAGRFEAPRSDTILAVAVNGVVEAVTRTWEQNPRDWLATPRFGVWRRGPNDLQVFIVETDFSGVLLRRVVVGRLHPDLNLLSEEAARNWGVRQAGFYGAEVVEDGRQFRWMRNVAEISNVLVHRVPLAVHVEVMMVPGGRPKNLRIEANTCSLFDGEVGHGWSATLSLERCDLKAEGFTLTFRTDAPRGAKDRRRLGVAMSRVVLR